MSTHSSAEVLVLHAVRLLGMATPRDVAQRFALDDEPVTEILLDDQAYGYVSHAEFAGSGGWSLTERGLLENERRLSAELDRTDGARLAVAAIYRAFLPLNARLQRACTDWQIRPAAGRPLAVNDHTDAAWDRRVISELGRLAEELSPLVGQLTVTLSRFAGYDSRFADAVSRVRAGDPTAVIGRDRTSAHAVWFELHEDLIATLGLTRSA